MNIKERVIVHQESIVVRMTHLNDHMQKELHERLVREKWFRDHPGVDTAESTFGPGHVTYYRWVDTDTRSYG